MMRPIGDRTTLNQLFNAIRDALQENGVHYTKPAQYRDFRAADVRHSQADTSKAASKLGYAPQYRISEGIGRAIPWFLHQAQLDKL